MQRLLSLLTVFTAVLFFQGCTTMADAAKGEGTGKKVTYDASYDKTWDASLKGLATIKDLELVSENKAIGQILAQRGWGVLQFSYGENVGIFVKKVTDLQTSVEVVSKKVMQTNIFAPNWSDEIQKAIKTELNK